MIRKIIDAVIWLYLIPIKLSTRLSLYVKGRLLSSNEHFLIAADVIRRKFSDSDGLIVDVGAFDGDSAAFFASRFKNSIIGFEPNPEPFTRAIDNLARFRNVEILNMGLSDAVGELDFYVSENEVSSSLLPIKDFSEITFSKKITVPVTTLDSFFVNHNEILLLKLDVQGAELSILNKGIETLKKTKLVLTEVSISEMYHGACMYYDLDLLLRQNNFKIHTVIANYNNEGTKYFDILYIKNM